MTECVIVAIVFKKKRVQQKLNLVSCTCHASSAESNHGQLPETSDKDEFE